MVPPESDLNIETSSSSNIGTEEKKEVTSSSSAQDALFKCCQRTIEDHGANNPMMVCSGCKQIIKRFTDEKAFNAYKKFCSSRHRKIFSTYFNNWHIVVFKSYDTFTS